ncbi:hypothetical protein N7501_009833 [Penicillium viridicatum]|nr:hypothetical protein N7501_009833 [Penicillium viridicatum]
MAANNGHLRSPLVAPRSCRPRYSLNVISNLRKGKLTITKDGNRHVALSPAFVSPLTLFSFFLHCPACITCREKCRRCDRTKPVCQRCINKGLKCKGYPEKFRFTGLATRGKWKNRAVPAVSRDHPIPTQPGSETDHPNAVHGELHRQNTSALTSCDDHHGKPSLPILNYPRPQPENRAVELDDLLMLERTELLLTHCILLLQDVGCQYFTLMPDLDTKTNG